MSQQLTAQIHHAVELIRQGEVVAYPTEAVFGLGCDPNNVMAIRRLLQLKQRASDQGLILVAADWQQVSHYTKPIAPALMANIQLTWPGPVTWLFPVAEWVSEWVRGQHSTIAIRISDHPIIQELCRTLDAPLISTSANLSGSTPARSVRMVKLYFGSEVFVIEGPLGGLSQPTPIYDALSGDVVRA